MEFVDPEDEPSLFRGPLHPDDRLWRHPSEFGPASEFSPDIAPWSLSSESVLDEPAGAPRLSMWRVAAVSALGASLLSSGLVILAGALLTGGERPAPVVEKEMVARPVATETPANTGGAGSAAAGIIEVAHRVRPTIAQVRTGMGTKMNVSAVLFRSDGHLLTSASVVAESPALIVVLADGREMPARLVGADPQTDVAVIKIDGGPYPVATLGSTAELEVGQVAIAMGSPAGMSGASVSLGVVSGLHRSVRARSGTTMLADMVQTDAAIAAGCPGGALVDADGSLIDITAAVAPADGPDAGLGFATPIELAHSVANQIITKGKVTDVWLGVEGGDLDPSTASNLDVVGGAVVGQVTPGGPAQRAGLHPHDVIVGIDGTAVVSMSQFVANLRRHQPGDLIVLTVVRSPVPRRNDPQPMRVTLAARPTTKAA